MDPTLVDDGGLRTSAEDISADVVPTAGEPESQVEPEPGPHCRDLRLELTDTEVPVGRSEERAFLRWKLLLARML